MTAPQAKTKGALSEWLGLGSKLLHPVTRESLFTWTLRVVSGSQNMEWLRN